MRILFLSPVGAIGGAERVLLTAIASLLRLEPGTKIRVLAPVDGPLLASASELGSEVEVVPMPTPLSQLGDSQLRSAGKWRAGLKLAGLAAKALPAALDYRNRLRNAIARFRPDVVHSNGIKTHLLSRFVVPSNIPLVWHLHDFYGLRPAAARLLRHASGNVRAGIAISQAVARDAARVLPRVPLTTVMNAVDLQRFAPGVGQDLDRLAGMAPAPNGTFRAGLVATYARWKGHETVLDAAKIVATEEPELPVRWYIIGGPIYLTAAQYSEAELRAGAEARGIADRVGFIPFQSDTAGIYRSLDAVVHASTLPEPFGLTVAEAMGCGRAVIVSAAGGALELFEEGRDGLGVQPGDANAIATSVKRLALDPELRAKIGSAARLTAEKRFDAIDYGLHLMEVYRSVVHSVVKSH